MHVWRRQFQYPRRAWQMPLLQCERQRLLRFLCWLGLACAILFQVRPAYARCSEHKAIFVRAGGKVLASQSVCYVWAGTQAHISATHAYVCQQCHASIGACPPSKCACSHIGVLQGMASLSRRAAVAAFGGPHVDENEVSMVHEAFRYPQLARPRATTWELESIDNTNDFLAAAWLYDINGPQAWTPFGRLMLPTTDMRTLQANVDNRPPALALQTPHLWQRDMDRNDEAWRHGLTHASQWNVGMVMPPAFADLQDVLTADLPHGSQAFFNSTKPWPWNFLPRPNSQDYAQFELDFAAVQSVTFHSSLDSHWTGKAAQHRNAFGLRCAPQGRWL